MDDGPHRRMYTLDAGTPAPHRRPAPVHTGSNDRLHRGYAGPGTHGVAGTRQHCRGNTATSDYSDTGRLGNVDTGIDSETRRGDACNFSAGQFPDT